MEAVGEGGTEALDVTLVVEEATEAVAAPEGIEVEIERRAPTSSRRATGCCCARC